MNDKSTEQVDAPPQAEDTKTSTMEEARTLPPTGKMVEPITTEDMPNIPGYRIDGVLGRGGMGIVYLATDLALQRQVAIKLGFIHAQTANRARFQSEAAALARLQHPHIVQIYGTGTTTNGLNYFIMEYVAQGSLADLTEKQPQSPRDAARLIQLLAKAVHAAHQRGIIHRDLKPGNILLAAPADEPALNCAWGCPKIADFGLVKLLDVTSPEQQATTTGQVLGTPSYMAPEQARSGKTIGPATDVYALGAILYMLLAGRPPFQGGTSIDVILQMIEEAPPSLKALRPELPDTLIAICEKCLAKKAEERFGSASELAQVMEDYIADNHDKMKPFTTSTQGIRKLKPTDSNIASKASSSLSNADQYFRLILGSIFPSLLYPGEIKKSSTSIKLILVCMPLTICWLLWLLEHNTGFFPNLLPTAPFFAWNHLFLTTAYTLTYLLMHLINLLIGAFSVPPGSKMTITILVILTTFIALYAVMRSMT